MTRAGQLDRQITIQQKSVTLDPTYGTELVEWVPLSPLPGSPTVAGRTWANVQDVLPSRAEGVAMGLAVAKNQTRIRFRFRADVDSSMRVIVHWDTGDVTMSIIGGPATIGRKEFTEVMCERYSV